MRTASIFWAVAAILTLGAVACAQTDSKPAKAPDFNAKGSDGKDYSLKSLTEKGPVFLYFVKKDCGSNPIAVKLFNRVFKAYEGKARLVAVVNADSDGFKEF